MRVHGWTYLLGLGATMGLALALFLTGAEPNEAVAETDTQTITVSCASGSTAAYASGITFGLTVASNNMAATTFETTPGASLAGNTTVSTTTLTSAINGDSIIPGDVIAEADEGHATGWIRLRNAAPTAKLAGLLCAGGGNHSSKLEAIVLVANADMNSGLHIWAEDKHIGDLGTAAVVFGAGGILGTSNITDDNGAAGDGATDGEVVFGKGSTHGAYDVTNSVHLAAFRSSASFSNTVSYGFTAMP